MNNLDTLENKKMASISDTCGIVVNYKTPDLIKKYYLISALLFLSYIL